MMDSLKSLLSKLPPARGLAGRVAELTEEVERLRSQIAAQGCFEAGHFYSPIPSKADVEAHLNARTSPPKELPDVDLDPAGQLAFLQALAPHCGRVPFPDRPTPTHRYHSANPYFSLSDALYLSCFLLHARIVEIGSGFSSAAMLDTFEREFDQWPHATFVDPDPERFLGILKPGDRERIAVESRRIQDVPPDVLLSLRAGDLLFVDSSHVAKCGSDVLHLLFEILPHLPPGVFVHFHDMFHPFEYPADWYAQGRSWNEAWFVRAFLAYNSEWSVRLFGSWASLFLRDFLEARMPDCARIPTASLYVSRRESPAART